MSRGLFGDGDMPPAEPPPPVPPDADLRDFPGMQLDVQRLRDSALTLEAPDVFRIAVLSWCAAWHQVPAGSLPDNDHMLARLLGFRDAGNVRRFRDAGKLRGWVRHSDGRLYHPVVSEKVLEALAMRRAGKRKPAQAPADREGQGATRRPPSRRNAPPDAPPDAPPNAPPDAGGASYLQVVDSGHLDLTKGREGKGRESTRVPDSSVQPPAAEAGEPAPWMPTLGDIEARWAHLGDGWEIDPQSMKGQSRLTCGGFYLVPVAQDVARAAGWRDPKFFTDWRVLTSWLRGGIDPYAVAIPVIERMRHRAREPIGSLRYFDAAVRREAEGHRSNRRVG